MIRDGKKTPLKRTGLVYRITEELITAARQSVLEEDEMVKDLTSNPNKIPGIENRRKSIFAFSRTSSSMHRMNSVNNSNFRKKASFEDSNYSSAEDDDDESDSDGTRGRDEISSNRRTTRRPFSHDDDESEDESEDDDVDNQVQLGAYSSHVRRPNGKGTVSININEESKVSFAESIDRGGIKHRSPPKPPKPTDNSSYAEI